MYKRKQPSDYRALAMQVGFKWLGPIVLNVLAKTTWGCSQGHQWEARFADIQRGSGCPHCSGKARKVIADYQALAKKRGFSWIGPSLPVNTRTKTEWECKHGHCWMARYGNVAQGWGCPYCVGHARKIFEDYHLLAKKRKFQWIGLDLPHTVDTKTKWECEQGHRWEARYHDIERGRGCPHCIDMVNGSRVSQPQRELCKMLNGKLNHPVGRRRIDIALSVEDIPIAIEYDSWYWHQHRQNDDARRDEELLAAGWRILHIKSNKQLPTKERLDVAIAYLLAGVQQTEIVMSDWSV